MNMPFSPGSASAADRIRYDLVGLTMPRASRRSTISCSASNRARSPLSRPSTSSLPRNSRCARTAASRRLCPRRIFAERFDAEVLAPWSRRTARLDCIIRRRGRPTFTPPTVIGIDDWAWRRNQRYGTLICDLERRQTIALLLDWEPAPALAWFTAQPQITIVAGTGASAMPWPQPKPFQQRHRSPIAGTSWGMRARPSSPPFAHPCTRSVPPSAQPLSTRIYRPLPNAFIMRDICTVRIPTWPFSNPRK